MPLTTFGFLDALKAAKTALAGSNASGHLSPLATLADEEAAVLKGQKARTASLPVALSTEDANLLNDLLTNADLEARIPAPISGRVPVAVQGTVILDSSTLTALETIQVSNFPATQPVSGTVTVANLPAPISGRVPVETDPVDLQAFTPVNSHLVNNTLASAATLTPPATSDRVLLQATGQAVRYTLDGSTPTATTGFRLLANTDPMLFILPIGAALKVIEEIASATLQIQWGK